MLFLLAHLRFGHERNHIHTCLDLYAIRAVVVLIATERRERKNSLNPFFCIIVKINKCERGPVMRNISDLPLGWSPFPPRISVRFPEVRPVHGRASNDAPHSPVEDILLDYNIHFIKIEILHRYGKDLDKYYLFHISLPKNYEFLVRRILDIKIKKTREARPKSY